MSTTGDLAALVGDPAASREQLRRVLSADLGRSRAELDLPRSGVPVPVTVALAATPGALLALLPVDQALRVDPGAVGERGWLLCAAAVGALVEAGASPDGLQAGAAHGALLLRAAAGPAPEAELAALALEEQVATIDRLRARGLVVPAAAVEADEPPRPLPGGTHPLAVAARIAALGGRPADPRAGDRLEEEVLAGGGPPRPHDDPDPARRVARRIAQRLDGMGKWGGYHTEWAHLARGFAGNDRRLAEEVGEAMLRAGLLREKPSVGQRHVCLDPSHAGEVRALVDRGEVPATLVLPAP